MGLFNFGRKEKKGAKSKGWRKRRHAEPRSYTVEDKVRILKEYEAAEGTIAIDRFDDCFYEARQVEHTNEVKKERGKGNGKI